MTEELNVKAAAAVIVDYSRAVATAHTPLQDERARGERDAVLDVWAALIGCPGDRPKALHHAYVIALEGAAPVRT